MNKDVLIIEGPVIPIDVKDADGDSLNAKEIKTLFTNFESQETDTMHSMLKNKGVTIIGNQILDFDKWIAGNLIKKGSWVSTIRVDNPELSPHILNGDLTGFSLATLPDFAREFGYLLGKNDSNEKRKTYNDIRDFSKSEPKWISFVDKPNHGLPFAVFTLDDFVNKRKYFEEDNMTKKENEEKGNEDGLAMKIIHALINKAEEKPVETSTPTEPQKTEKYVTPEEMEAKFKAFGEEIDQKLKSFGEEIVKQVKEVVPNSGETAPENDPGGEGAVIEKNKPSESSGDKHGTPEEPPKEGKQHSQKPEKVENPMIEKSFQELRAERKKKNVLVY